MEIHPRYFLEIAFNGTPYRGWQLQPDAPSVQAEVEKALRFALHQQRVVVVGCKSDYRLGRRASPLKYDGNAGDDAVVSQTPRPFAWGVQMAREVDAYAYIETSALTGQNVDMLVPLLLEAAFAHDKTAKTKKCALM